MKKTISITIIVLFLLILSALAFDWGRNDAQVPVINQNTASSSIIVSYPQANQEVTSPIHISGKVAGNWFFEGSFPIQLLDSDGDIIATTTVATSGDWATTSVIDFSATLFYPHATTTERALIVLSNDNPSGNTAHNQSEYVPVILK